MYYVTIYFWINLKQYVNEVRCENLDHKKLVEAINYVDCCLISQIDKSLMSDVDVVKHAYI